MNENESFTVDDLEECSYRYLQGVAKNLKLPSNVKKVHLINMIYAKKYRTESELEAIIKQVREERQIISIARTKQNARRRKSHLQGEEISSTSPNSPIRGSNSHMIQCSPSIIKYRQNELRPRLKAPSPRRSDRLLRSVANRHNYKYLLNNTVIGVIKSQSTIKKPKPQVQIEKKPPMDTKIKYVINQFKTSIVNSRNAIVKKNLNELKIQTCLRNRQQPPQIIPQPIKRKRTLSGIYPLNPQENQPKTTFINIRGKDGKITKINAFVQPKDYSIENYETKNLNIGVTVQDIINSNINAQVSNKYTNINKDYPNMFPVTETAIDKGIKAIQESVDQTNLKDNRSLLIPRFYPRLSVFSQAPSMRETSPDRLQIYYQKDLTKIDIGTHENQAVFNQNHELESPVTCCVERRNQQSILDRNQALNRQELYPNLRPVTIPIYTRTETFSNYPQMVSTYTQSEISSNFKPEIPNFRTENTNLGPKVIPNYGQEIPYIPQQNEIYLNRNLPLRQNQQESYYNTNQWVYNQNHFNQNNYSMDFSGEFSTYCHKKIRAEQIRSKRDREMSDNNVNSNSLPRINQVFSRFNDMEKDLTQPLYVQVSDESERILNYPIFMAKNHSTNLLENLYNFKNSFITSEPVLHMVTTTSKTNCTYSTPIITTPKAQTSTMVSSDFYAASSVVDNPSTYTGTPRLYELLKVVEQEAALRKTYRPTRSSSSTSSARSSPDADVTIPEMEDAMEIISQDGDYMERITSDLMDPNAQCYICSWAGPRILYEYHLKKDHPDCTENGTVKCTRIPASDPVVVSPEWSPNRDAYKS